jgi:streptogramin lyase
MSNPEETLAMRHSYWTVRTFILAVMSFIALAPLVQAQGRTEVTINDTGVNPENLTSSQDGTVYFGSRGKGNIYRAAPGASQAEPWILAADTGLTNVFGVLADEKTGTLWVCSNSTGGRGGTPVVGQTAVRTFDLKSGAAKGNYPIPGGGICNDVALASDGTAYISETSGNRVLRLKPGATTAEVWIVDQQLVGVDGISILPDGAVYVNTYFAGLLLRIPVTADGSAGPMVQLETSLPIKNPDGLRAIGPRTFLQIENAGRVTEITVNGNRADVRVVGETPNGATGVTLVGDTALALVSGARAVIVPYRQR